MYAYRKKRLPVTAWLVPVCIFLLAAAALVVDYSHQHVHVSVFGQSIDAQNVRQVVVVPSSTGAGAPASTATYSVNGHSQIVGLLRDLGAAQPTSVADQTVLSSKQIESVYIELQNGTWQLTLLKSQRPGQVLIQYQDQLFTGDAGLLTLLQKP